MEILPTNQMERKAELSEEEATCRDHMAKRSQLLFLELDGPLLAICRYCVLIGPGQV